MHYFKDLIEQLGKALGIDDLKAEEHKDVCSLTLKNQMRVDIEMSRQAPEIVITAMIGEPPPGRYRENFCLECLKANGQDWPRFGNFAYSPQTHQIILFDQIPLEGLDGNHLNNILQPFLTKATQWQEALRSGSLPNTASNSSHKSSNPFGL